MEHSLNEEIRTSHKIRFYHILEKLAAKRSLDVSSFLIRELIEGRTKNAQAAFSEWWKRAVCVSC